MDLELGADHFFCIVGITVLCRTALVPGADRCFIINGGLTLYGKNNISWAVPLTLNLIKHTMNYGALNDEYTGLVDVRFLNKGYINTLPDSSNPSDPSTGDDNVDDLVAKPEATITNNESKKENWMWVVLGCGLFVLLTAVFVIRRRKRQADKVHEYEEASRIPPELSGSDIGSRSDAYLRDESDFQYHGSGLMNHYEYPDVSGVDSFENRRRHFV